MKTSTRPVARTKAPDPPPMRATTIRLTPENEHGLRLLNAELQRPINKLVNQAVSSFIETQTEHLERQLEQTLANLRAYRRRDPGFRKAIAHFVDAEAKLPDGAEGKAVAKVRGAVLGR